MERSLVRIVYGKAGQRRANSQPPRSAAHPDLPGTLRMVRRLRMGESSKTCSQRKAHEAAGCPQSALEHLPGLDSWSALYS
jgi:hypothetical protein